jgi:phosphoglycerate dehydrogenase-like enzyme
MTRFPKGRIGGPQVCCPCVDPGTLDSLFLRLSLAQSARAWRRYFIRSFLLPFARTGSLRYNQFFLLTLVPFRYLHMVMGKGVIKSMFNFRRRKTAYICLSDFNPAARDLLARYFDLTVRPPGPRPDSGELMQLVKDYDLLVIGQREKITKEVYDCATKVRIIGTLSIGLDHILPALLLDKNFIVINTPEANVVSVAEHALGLAFALSKVLLDGNRASFSHEGRSGMKGTPHDLSGKVLGIIGAGRIGTRMLKYGSSLGMSVLCHTQHPKAHSALSRIGVTFVNLETLLVSSDIVSVHVPLADDTRYMLNAETIQKMKEGAILINTSRADILNIRDLSEALRAGRIGGAGLDDVNDQDIDLLSNMANVIVTPHVAGVTVEAISRMDTELAERIVSHVRNH